jgi:hypothetical protein
VVVEPRERKKNQMSDIKDERNHQWYLYSHMSAMVISLVNKKMLYLIGCSYMHGTRYNIVNQFLRNLSSPPKILMLNKIFSCMLVIKPQIVS